MFDRRLCYRRLRSGGLIVNYACSSTCAHCLYRSSPVRDHAYITPACAAANFAAVRRLGCRSLHIGGGEPFLSAGGLEAVLEAAQSEGVGIEYIETNSSWFHDTEQAVELLTRLRQRGCRCLLLSISPFHAAYIPLRKVKGVMAACRLAGLDVFPWVMEFFDEIDSLGDDTAHSLEAMEHALGSGYVRRIPARYHLTMGGRALDTYARFMTPLATEEVLARGKSPCRHLADTTHFHIDLYGRLVPALCPGLSVERADLGEPLSPERYPILTLLYTQGVSALVDFACREYGFSPANAYVSHCQLCHHVRGHLSTTAGDDLPELRPAEFYQSE